MNVYIEKLNPKLVLLLFGLAAILFTATMAQASIYAGTSVATLNKSFNAKGKNLNVHDGSTNFRMSNSSTSRNIIYGKIKKSLTLAPDPVMYSTSVHPGKTTSTKVALSPSTYYAYAESARFAATGKVVIEEK